MLDLLVRTRLPGAIIEGLFGSLKLIIRVFAELAVGLAILLPVVVIEPLRAQHKLRLIPTQGVAQWRELLVQLDLLLCALNLAELHTRFRDGTRKDLLLHPLEPHQVLVADMSE